MVMKSPNERLQANAGANQQIGGYGGSSMPSAAPFHSMVGQFEMAEKLKGASMDYLKRYVRNPSGNIPLYMVMAELQRRIDGQRRAKMADAAAKEKRPTVAQQVLDRAGMTQEEGIMSPVAAFEQAQANRQINARSGGLMQFNNGGQVQYTSALASNPAFIDYVLKRQKNMASAKVYGFDKALPRPTIVGLINKAEVAARNAGIPNDKIDTYLSLLAQESAFHPFADSGSSKGIGQIKPSTAREPGAGDYPTADKVKITDSSRLFNIDDNLAFSAAYFKDSLDRVGGDTNLALAGYNAGGNKVAKIIEKLTVDGKPPSFKQVTDAIEAGRKGQKNEKETTEYVANINNFVDTYSSTGTGTSPTTDASTMGQDRPFDLGRTLKKIGTSVSEGITSLPYQAVSVAGLPLTLTGIKKPEEIVGSLAYMRDRKGLFTPQQYSLEDIPDSLRLNTSRAEPQLSDDQTNIINNLLKKDFITQEGDTTTIDRPFGILPTAPHANALSGSDGTTNFDLQSPSNVVHDPFTGQMIKDTVIAPQIQKEKTTPIEQQFTGQMVNPQLGENITSVAGAQTEARKGQVDPRNVDPIKTQISRIYGNETDASNQTSSNQLLSSGNFFDDIDTILNKNTNKRGDNFYVNAADIEKRTGKNNPFTELREMLNAQNVNRKEQNKFLNSLPFFSAALKAIKSDDPSVLGTLASAGEGFLTSALQVKDKIAQADNAALQTKMLLTQAEQAQRNKDLDREQALMLAARQSDFANKQLSMQTYMDLRKIAATLEAGRITARGKAMGDAFKAAQERRLEFVKSELESIDQRVRGALEARGIDYTDPRYNELYIKARKDMIEASGL
jgi:hypothetical protein